MNFSLTQNYSKTGFIDSFDQTQLFFRHYEISSPKATVLIIHGFGEHSGRYSHVIERLLSEGFEVFCIDLRGHGHSKGYRGHINEFNDYIKDALAAIDFAYAKKIATGKFFILAHSMGALVSLSLMAVTEHTIAGLVLSCPLFALSLPLPWYKKYFSIIAAKIYPKLSLKSEIKGEYLSSDTQFSHAYDNDPLILKSVSIRAFQQIVKKLETCKNLMRNNPCPFLLQVAGRDCIVDSNAAVTWFKRGKNNSYDRTLKLYPEMLHEIYNESHKEEPINDAIKWLNQHA